tara:strand:+ start:829 stop:2226 length:1398 start_codon:yes stop_codon:yes gene_type:complete
MNESRPITDAEWNSVKADINRSLKQARTTVFSKHPHYALLMMRLSDVIVRAGNYAGKSLPTAATDGTSIYVNAEWYRSLPRKSKFPLFLHEVLHNVLGHSYRRKGRRQNIWNRACDYVINSILKEMGYSIPEWLHDEKYKGMSEERVYAALVNDDEDKSEEPEDEEAGEPEEGDSPEEPEEGQGGEPEEGTGDEAGDSENEKPSKKLDTEDYSPEEDDYGAAGQIWDPTTPEGNPLSDKEMDEAMNKVSDDLVEAEMISKTSGRGFEPRGRRAMERITRPKINWKSYMNRWVSMRGQVSGRSWGKLDRRSLQRGTFRPGVIREGLDWLVIAVDISSSISMDEFIAFMEHLDKLREDVKITRLTVLPFNEIVVQSQIIELKSSDPTPKTLATGGGTCFSPIFNWVDRQTGRPDGVIVFTDLCSTDFGTPPTCSVLWASTDEIYTGIDGWYSNVPPFGDTMQIDLSQ